MRLRSSLVLEPTSCPSAEMVFGKVDAQYAAGLCVLSAQILYVDPAASCPLTGSPTAAEGKTCVGIGRQRLHRGSFQRRAD